MATTNPETLHSYELPLAGPSPPRPDFPRRRGGSLPEPLLARNVVWFCGLRWIVVAILFTFGLLCHLWPGLFQPFGLHSPLIWPFTVAGILTVANIAFLSCGRAVWFKEARNGTRLQLWAQIVLDLVVLTGVVHFLGSVETDAPFAYLFHIVLACIFFSRLDSLAVLVVASALFAGVVSLEAGGFLQGGGIFADGEAPRSGARLWFSVASRIGIWMVVWYLASHLSAMVRTRDEALAATNRRLLEARRERARHVLRTTHELKAPFAAVNANAQLLLRGNCGALPAAARRTVQRIADRCQRLAGEIQEMLQLANLRSPSERPVEWKTVRLEELLRAAIDQVRVTAEERGIVWHTDLEPAATVGVEEHLMMMFVNLLSNAVLYSRQGGAVWVSCSACRGDGPSASIRDEGIGIEAEKLPRIFDDYYRTNEAARFNRDSTGLGLAMVRQVAETHRIRVRVDSSPGVGSRFVLCFSPPGEGALTDTPG